MTPGQLSRRTLLVAPAGFLLSSALRQPADLESFERERVLRSAARFLRESPITITASTSPRSAGGRHDFFSQGDYWWPDPANPEGPYIQRDGLTNPDNFVAHRKALMRLSVHVPALAAAWLLTKERPYLEHAERHLRAWFTDEATLMNPHLRYAQAIKGRVTGRGVGIIDTIHLVEVVRAASVLRSHGVLQRSTAAGLHDWVGKYLTWMTTHEYGITEREARNNHATCWVMQVAEFSRYTGDTGLGAYCRDRYRGVLVPHQVGPDGSFPEELRRTKPYGYSLFNLDAMATVCQILSTPGAPLWTFETADGRGIRKALTFMFPFIEDKERWPYRRDVMYYDEWPMRHPALLFGAQAFHVPRWESVWRRLRADSNVEEVIRNFFVRQPLLWSDLSQP
jgi:hypothetical protein